MGSDECDSYVLLLKRQVRDLHGLLKMRLRVELPVGSSQILASLNEKLLSFSEISNDFETLYSDLLERSKIANDSIMKANLYDSLSIKAKETESTLKAEVETLTSRVRILEDENLRMRTALTTSNEELLQRVEEVAKYRVAADSLEIDIKAKTLELSRVSTDRDSSKRQCLNLSSLLKQVAEEKDVKTLQITELKQQLNVAEKQLFEERQEVNAVREREKQRREKSLAVKDQELNEELALLQAQFALKNVSQSQSRARTMSSSSQNERNKQISSSVPQKALSTSEVRDDSSDDQELVESQSSKHRLPRINSQQPDSDDEDNHRRQHINPKGVDHAQSELEGDEEGEEDDDYEDNDEDERKDQTASFGDSSEEDNSRKKKTGEESMKKKSDLKVQTENKDEESNDDEDLSLDGGIENVKFDDADFSENDSIDFEVKRRIQIKQQLQQQDKQQQQFLKQKQQLVSSNTRSNRQANSNEKMMLTTEQSSIHSVASLDQLKKTDLDLSRSSSEENLLREAEKARELQRKRNQQRFEMNKLKLVSSKKTISSDEEQN